VNLREKGELLIVEEIRRKFPVNARIKVGIGDDAAVFASRGNLAVTTDMMMEGVHFDLSYISPFQLGFKLISVNVSDIYAMGGRPLFALLSMALRADMEYRFLKSFMDGIKEASKRYNISLIGGDISSTVSSLALCATLIGEVKNPIKRSGAKIGDNIFITGEIGLSSAGLELLKEIKRPIDLKNPINKPLKWHIMKPLLRSHLMPVAVSPSGFRNVTSMIDISDGLLIDLSRLCKESNLGALIYEELIPISPALRKASDYLGKDPLEFALSGGEDYELLFTSKKIQKNAIKIGSITKNGLYIIGKDGKKRPIKARGYEHFETQI